MKPMIKQMLSDSQPTEKYVRKNAYSSKANRPEKTLLFQIFCHMRGDFLINQLMHLRTTGNHIAGLHVFVIK